MTSDLYRRILKKLDVQEKEEGSLPLLLDFYRKLLRVQLGAREKLGVAGASLSREDIDERVKSGRPVLCFGDLKIDWSLLKEIFAEVTSVFHDYPGLLGATPEIPVRRCTQKLVKAWYEGADLPESVAAESGGLMPAMLQATLNPFLRSHAETLEGSFNGEFWRRRYCPICGGKPDFAFLERERGARWLVCSRCDTNWLYKRLECPDCGNQDQKSLAYFTDDEGLYRLYVCESCKHYIKAMDLRRDEAEVFMPLERLNTIDMDIQAQNRGYLPCGSPARS